MVTRWFTCMIWIGLMALGGTLFAQVPYPTQPQAGYYAKVKQLCKLHIPDSLELKALKPGGLPMGIPDSLMKYDWYEVSSYHYVTSDYSSYYLDIDKDEKLGLNVQLPFRRYQKNRVIYEMSLNHSKAHDGQVLTTTFDEGTAVKLVEVKRTQAGSAFLVTEAYGEKENQQILSLKDGILVMEIKDNPNANDLRKFRIAYRAVPKSF